ncbi:MAG: hypothetical protein AB2733_20380 [Candidatus Thiodiazotropha taylori]
MKRALLLIAGPIGAGMFAMVMYTIHGNMNWGSDAEKSLPWFEPTFWVIFLSGVPLVIINDLISFVRKRGDSQTSETHTNRG